MNLRISFILLVLVAVVGGYVLIFELNRQPEKAPQPLFFYDVELGAIIGVSVTYHGQREEFIRQGSNDWFFENSGEPVNMDRWGGIPLLLTGPRAASVLKERIDNPAEYGLDPPETYITITIQGGRQISVLVGGKTPDGVSSYAQVVGNPSLYLVTSSWSDLINRLVTEPPVVSATPEGAESTPQ